MAETSAVAGVRERDGAAVAHALALVEDTRPSALAEQRALLSALAATTPSERIVVGLTGPPGAGKSSLAARLIRHWVGAGLGVGMVAVDPSSRRSHGALLGDRARLRFSPDEPVFVRSMAAGDQLGGLAPATRAAVAVLRAGYDVVLVETVGVGQSEIDVESVTDSVILVMPPDSGDTLQFMKAGILEIPDVFAVHKWDLGAPAERTHADLVSMLALQPRPRDAWTPPVVCASSHTGNGVPDLAFAVRAHADWAAANGTRETRRREGREAWAFELLLRRYGTLGVERLGGRAQVVAEIEASAGTALDCFSELASRAGLEKPPA